MHSNKTVADCPSVDVLLSIYKPNTDYLIRQLQSINSQIYPNIRLVVHNDCPNDQNDIDLFKTVCPNIPIEFLPETGVNYGYTKAFERLVKYSSACYIAFCDQDDIWAPNKISRMVEVIQEDRSLLAASERTIIDENGRVIKERSRTGSKKGWDTWKTGDDIFVKTSVICYAVGMSMLVNGDFVRNIIPFSNFTGHDKWAIICAAAEGKVSFIDEPLVQYRRHGHNVSGTLVGINNKADYFKKRIEPFLKLCTDIQNRYPDHKDIDVLKTFANARKTGDVATLLKYRSICPQVALFDAVVAITPNALFKSLVAIARRL